MGYNANRARYESSLARAHRALYYAQEAAEELRDPGAADDCAQILREISRLADASLKGKARPQLAGQLKMV
jgi:hypothetical protein